MWYKFLTLFAALTSSSLLWGAAINFPGDGLSQGSQYVATTAAMQDWYYSASFIANAKEEAIDDNNRGAAKARNKGYGFQSDLTYLLGITDRLNLGFRYGYQYDKSKTTIDATTGDALEGELTNEGGTDLTLLGHYRFAQHSTWDVEVQLPICSSDSVGSVCHSKQAKPNNAQQAGETGGQGNGYYTLMFGVSSNWLSMTDNHWMGRLYGRASVSDSVAGETVSAPAALGGQFGLIVPIKANHQWSIMLSLESMFAYSSYSPLLQRQVAYGDQSFTALKAEYLWDVWNAVQVKPFIDLTLRQQPSETFTENGLRRRFEYTAGTLVTLGAQLSASF